MTNVIIIHGTSGSPESNWFPWLNTELEKLGCKVFIPKFPTPNGQSLSAWLSVFKEYEQYLDENTIVIGHSLGSAFLLSVIEATHQPIKHAFFISAFLGLLNDPRFDVPNKTFTTRSFDWTKIKSNCKGFTVINSDNDPYVPIEKGREFAENLGVELVILKNAGHINKDSGYTDFPLLLEKIKKLF
ncbi:MAG: alpha/beta hydrolase [bacterium]|nr:alpha/beta hydrolase [bacterium]